MADTVKMEQPNIHDESVEANDALPAAEGIREDLIATAVKFLQNPKVRQSPVHLKKAFLERKGLTKEEIELSIQRSGILQDENHITQQYSPPVTAGRPLVPARVPEDKVYSRWAGTRDVLAVVTMVTGITYAVHRLYQEFLKPWLFGVPCPHARLEAVESSVAVLQTSLQQTLEKVQITLTTVQETMVKQQENLQILSLGVTGRTTSDNITTTESSQCVRDIKAELTSIKGLLLNRRQFPPTPASTPVLPSWQLESLESKENSTVTQESTSLVKEDEEKESNIDMEKDHSQEPQLKSNPKEPQQQSPESSIREEMEMEDNSDNGEEERLLVNSDIEERQMSLNKKDESDELGNMGDLNSEEGDNLGPENSHSENVSLEENQIFD